MNLLHLYVKMYILINIQCKDAIRDLQIAYKQIILIYLKENLFENESASIVQESLYSFETFN